MNQLLTNSKHWGSNIATNLKQDIFIWMHFIMKIYSYFLLSQIAIKTREKIHMTAASKFLPGDIIQITVFIHI